jgi:hypothetical protein
VPNATARSLRTARSHTPSFAALIISLASQ